MISYAKDVRSKLKTGDLLAWSHGSWRSWYDIQVNFVRMFTRSEYSHVGMAYVENGRVFILESVGSGVRIFPLSRELPFFWIPRPRSLSEDALQFAFAKLGDPYSKFQAVLAGLGMLGIGKDSNWQCAEYTLATYRADGEEFDCSATPTAVVRAAMEKWGAPCYIVGDKNA